MSKREQSQSKDGGEPFVLVFESIILGRQLEKRRLMSWSVTEETRKEKRIFEIPFPAGDSQKEERVFLEGIRLVA